MRPGIERRVQTLEAKAFSSTEPDVKRLAFPAEILEGWQAQGLEFAQGRHAKLAASSVFPSPLY
jgi:hypothetical protein